MAVGTAIGYGLALVVASLGAWAAIRSRTLSRRLAGIIIFAFSAFTLLLIFWGSYEVR